MNDSSTGGYLVPEGATPLEDDAFTDFLQSVIVGITAIPGRYVRPRWQPEPPNLPPSSATWVAFGIAARRADTFPYIQHDTDINGVGSDTVVQNENFDLFCSFYGPSADPASSLLREGLMIAQNREAMLTVGIKLIAIGPRAAVPELIKEKWLYRTDLNVEFRREVRRTYPVLNLLSAHGTILTGTLTEPIEVTGD